MRDDPRETAEAASPWPRRLALWTLAAAVPLVFFGGTVTTLHAGLAIDGWLVLEPGRGDHFLWLYPVDKWFRDVGTFVEHTHRLFGSLVGLLAVATLVATFALDRRRSSRALATAALLGVVVQGVIGGLRVLEQSEDLAFLHGAIAQAVFALLGASWLAASSAAVPGEPAGSTRLAWVTAASVYLQIVAGAWLRHGGGVPALAVHGVLAAVAGILVLILARSLGSAAGSHALRRSLLALLAIQFALGFAAFAVVWLGPARASGAAPLLGTSVFPTLHVLVGGALLLACVSSVFRARGWRSARAGAAIRTPGLAPLGRLETAR
jgi:cytochrome c oxidase assembly protein subunit 15